MELPPNQAHCNKGGTGLFPEFRKVKKLRVLITGGAGFIGSNLVDYLARHKPAWKAVVLDDLSTGDLQNLDQSSCEFIDGSILSPEQLSTAMTGVDRVVHLAAIPSVPRSVNAPLPSHHANATGTLLVLEEARRAGVSQVIVAGSSSVYGSNPILPKHERTWTRPMSPYAVSKLATESYAIAHNYAYGMRNLAFRFFNVFGPRQAPGHAYAAVIPQFIYSALRGDPLPIHGDGLQSRDFTYVETVCSVIADALEREVTSNDPVNLAFGTNTSLNTLAGVIEKHLGRTLERNHLAGRVGDVRASQADATELKRLFPDASPVPLDRGVAETIEWFHTRDVGSR